jgi:hypothetical protein
MPSPNLLRTDYITDTAQHAVDAPINALKQQGMQQDLKTGALQNQIAQHDIDKLKFQDLHDVFKFFKAVAPDMRWEDFDKTRDMFLKLSPPDIAEQLDQITPSQADFKSEEEFDKWKTGTIDEYDAAVKESEAKISRADKESKAKMDRLDKESKAKIERQLKEATTKEQELNTYQEAAIYYGELYYESKNPKHKAERDRYEKLAKKAEKEDTKLKNIMDRIQSVKTEIRRLQSGVDVWLDDPQRKEAIKKAQAEVKKLTDRYVELGGNEKDVAGGDEEQTPKINPNDPFQIRE